MKAILVIDIDDELFDKYDNFYVDYDLWGEDYSEDYYDIKKIKQVKDCLLKPLPQKKNLAQYSNIGWNACIDEILGEEDD